MMKLLIGPMILFLVGCGTAPEALLPGDGPKDQPIPGPEGPQGPAGDPSVLSWGVFGGHAPVVVLASGGPVEISRFWRESKGVYRIVYGIRTAEVGPVAIVGTAHGSQLPDGQNLISLVAVEQAIATEFLTIKVMAVLSGIESPDVVLANFDTVFSLVVFGGQ